MTVQKIGIDKLILTCRDFSVTDAQVPALAHDRNKRQGAKDDSLPYLLTDERGRDIYAHKMWHNTTQLNLSIDKKHGLGIGFNPDKIIDDYQLSEINSPGFNQSLTTIDTHLQKIGIKVNLDAMKLNRVDLAKQHVMSFDISQYGDAFRCLSSKRTMNKRNYLETHTIGNSHHQVSFYDKKHELASVHRYITESNLMRCEIRTLKSQCTQRTMHSETLADFKKLQPGDVMQIYNSYMQKNIFRTGIEAHQMQIDFSSEIELIKNMKKAHSKNLLLMHLASVNIDEYLQMIGGTNNLLKLYEQAGCSRAQIYRYRDTLQQILKLSQYTNRAASSVSVFQLVDELKSKFAA